ncbi:MAG: ATP synthase F1 subunit epsilon [Firmicutes bacterium]|nr:ATP synthase F1 subunit epsilon [Bacillota bacterium]MBO2521882.1 ATP synthase F1 subunit epsilon [Bacillota bacterium]
MLRLEVVTPERRVLSTEAESVIVPGVDGYIGFLKNHAPLVAGMSVGIVQFGPERGEKRRVAVTGGFVEVADNRVTVLADTAELDTEIDVGRAQAARERAEKRLRSGSPEIDRARAEAALQRALNRLRAARAI